MAEYVVDHERYVNVVPPDLREIAVLAEPLTIAEKALEQIFWMMQNRPPWLDPQTPSTSAAGGFPRWCSASVPSGAGSHDAGHGRLHHVRLLTRAASQSADRPGQRHRRDLRLLPDDDVP